MPIYLPDLEKPSLVEYERRQSKRRVNDRGAWFGIYAVVFLILLLAVGNTLEAVATFFGF